ncbi:MAG: glycosyltransferase family 2 protein [Bryobacteraceae bacterium]
MPLDHDSGAILEEIDCPFKTRVGDTESLGSFRDDPSKRIAILLNGSLNYSLDVQGALSRILPSLSRSSRIIAILYNPYLKLLYHLSNSIGIREAPVPTTFLTLGDIRTFARLSGYELVGYTLCGYCPWRLAGLGNLINAVFSILPLVRWLALSCVVTLRPVIASQDRPGLSIVIPARNEFGNIEAALRRMPDLGCPLEVIFVEGHSSDPTWEEIERVRVAYSGRFRILSRQQTGKGKSDAVRLGFSIATMPVLTILDADLTMPPEMLTRFYEAYVEGLGDFINGSRLVYPMEGEAMRFLNQLGNIFFAKSLSYVLNARLGDSLCGTKLLARHDYERMVAWRGHFGDFDPFGDFELLFPAAILHLGVMNLPIRYAARTYGSTNISRFRNGFQLLRMTVIGFVRIKCGLGRHG